MNTGHPYAEDAEVTQKSQNRKAPIGTGSFGVLCGFFASSAYGSPLPGSDGGAHGC